MIERNVVTEYARRFDIDEYTVLREYLQLIFLRNLYDISECNHLYFKGGTSLHFLLHSFRFSEDLDFTASIKQQNTDRIIQLATKKTRLEAPDLKVETRSSTRLSSSYRLIFPTELSRQPLTIRVEISTREKPLTRRISVIETELPVSPYPMVVHLDYEEILAEKIRAILTRSQGRDIFDTWFMFSKGVQLNNKYIEEKMKYYKQKYSLQVLKRTIEDIDAQSLKDDIAKFLPQKTRRIIGELKGLLFESLHK